MREAGGGGGIRGVQGESAANALVVRYSLPDAEHGGGIDSAISLYVNGKLIKDLPITSHYSYLYGNYPFSDDPAKGRVRDFYNEARVKDLRIRKGDVVRLQKRDESAAFCIVDFVDLEKIAPALAPPDHSLCVTNFGASGHGDTDDTEALRQCIGQAEKDGSVVWVPAVITS